MPLTTPGYIDGIVGGSRSQFDNMLKELYGKLFENHLHKATDTLQFLRARKGRLGGRRTIEVAVVGRPQSAHNYRLERSRLPTPSTGTYQPMEIDCKFAYIRLRETFEGNALSQGGGARSFGTQRVMEYKLARDTAAVNAERMCIIGQKDILGTVASHTVTGSTSVITLDARTARNSTSPWAAGGRYFEPNMSISIVDSTSGAGGATDSAFEAGGEAREIKVRSVTDKHGSSPQITIERANEDNSGDDADLTGAPWSFTPADGDYIIPWNSRATTITAGAAGYWDFATPWGLQDLKGASQTSHLYGVSKASFPTFVSKVNENSGTPRQFTELLVATHADAVMNEGGGMPIDFALGEHSIRREAAALYQGRQEYGPVVSRSGFAEAMLLELGQHRVPLLINWLYPVGELCMGVRGEAGWYSLMDYTQLDQGLARRFVPNYAQSEEVYVSAGNWVLPTPNCFGFIDDLVASTTEAPAGGV